VTHELAADVPRYSNFEKVVSRLICFTESTALILDPCLFSRLVTINLFYILFYYSSWKFPNFHVTGFKARQDRIMI
jgi:hypothetical protein